MANVIADNAKFAEMLVWAQISSNTPIVYTYVCPVDTHPVVSPVRLQYYDADYDGSVDDQTDGVAICPLHSVELTGEAAVDVS